MELFAADSADRRSNLEALVNIANGGQPADMADVLQKSQRAANDGNVLYSRTKFELIWVRNRVCPTQS